jgi:hypothetical protein
MQQPGLVAMRMADLAAIEIKGLTVAKPHSKEGTKYYVHTFSSAAAASLAAMGPLYVCDGSSVICVEPLRMNNAERERERSMQCCTAPPVQVCQRPGLSTLPLAVVEYVDTLSPTVATSCVIWHATSVSSALPFTQRYLILQTGHMMECHVARAALIMVAALLSIRSMAMKLGKHAQTHNGSAHVRTAHMLLSPCLALQCCCPRTQCCWACVTPWSLCAARLLKP